MAPLNAVQTVLLEAGQLGAAALVAVGTGEAVVVVTLDLVDALLLELVADAVTFVLEGVEVALVKVKFWLSRV